MIESALILHDPPEKLTPMGHRRIAGLVLLGGSVRPTRFHTAVGRSLLDLPYKSGRTLLDEWYDQAANLSTQLNLTIPLRVLSDKTTNGDGPLGTLPKRTISVKFDHDPSEWRGTGGVLRDISAEYASDELLLVANAAQFLLRPLPELTAELYAVRADIAVLAHRDGTPTTLMLVRCGSLSALPEVGFIDMKEQAIPLLSAIQNVRAVYVDHPVVLGLRTAQSYLAGLRALHARSQGSNGDTWRSAFALIEEGAKVDSSARLHDSVVLSGGTVGAGAVLVRTVVCAGGVIPRKEVVVDKLITSDGQFDSEEGQ